RQTLPLRDLDGQHGGAAGQGRWSVTDLDQTARAGEVLGGKYRLLRLIGRGGMGCVYEAKHRNGRHVAVKLLAPDLARDAEIRKRFLREGYAANAVDHPRVVQVLDD